MINMCVPPDKLYDLIYTTTNTIVPCFDYTGSFTIRPRSLYEGSKRRAKLARLAHKRRKVKN
jgi:hypothetical protein